MALYKIKTAVIALLLIILDQITKILIHANFTENESIDVIPGILDLTYVKNRGAAFGILSGHRWVFLSVTTLILIAAVFLLLTDKIKDKLTIMAAMLIISGGIGNMIDRIFREYVVDFVNFKIINFYVFNIADSCVVIGSCLIIFKLLKEMHQDSKGMKAGAK